MTVLHLTAVLSPVKVRYELPVSVCRRVLLQLILLGYRQLEKVLECDETLRIRLETQCEVIFALGYGNSNAVRWQSNLLTQPTRLYQLRPVRALLWRLDDALNRRGHAPGCGYRIPGISSPSDRRVRRQRRVAECRRAGGAPSNIVFTFLLSFHR